MDRNLLKQRRAEEETRFALEHPRSREMFERAHKSLLGGVPMNWMVRWAGPFPIFVRAGQGAHFADVDGREYIDFCLGDTGAMTGHAPPAATGIMAERLQSGVTFMLPTEDSLWVGEELSRRFGLPLWQFALTATDANRFALRLARHITGRKYVLVFNWCYHGTVDETFITLHADGTLTPRAGNLGPPVDPARTTKVVEFNDLNGLVQALGAKDVACVLAEPVMTNIGIVHPDPGFHAALREITRRTGTLLILDETHTICAGPGGYTGAYGLQPDMLTLGKPLGSGVPGAAYGLSAEVAERIQATTTIEDADTGGIGGTLAGNALSISAMKVTLQNVLTPEAYEHMIPLAETFQHGVEGVIEEFGLPWIVKRLGCRVEYWFRPAPPRNGAEAAAAVDAELDRYMHLAALNRGILMTPFHNMALMSPATSADDVAAHTRAFRESVAALI